MKNDKPRIKNVWSKIMKVGLTPESKEYQRMLAGTRIYFSFMSQKRFVNLTFVLFLFVFFLSIFLVLLYIFYKEIFPIMPLIPIFIFYIVFIIILFFISILREHQFSVLKGFIIFIRGWMNLFIIICYLIIIIIFSMIYQLAINLNNLLVIPGNIIFALLLLLLLQICIYLNSSSIISYAKEQVQKVIELEDKKDEFILSKFQLYYLAIFRYYEMEIYEIKNYYRKDVLELLKIKKFPILASQILYNDKRNRKKLIKILSSLEKYQPIKNVKKFIKTMDEIEKKFGKLLAEKNKKIDFENIFKKITIFNYLKLYSIIMIPILTGILNFFLQKI